MALPVWQWLNHPFFDLLVNLFSDEYAGLQRLSEQPGVSLKLPKKVTFTGGKTVSYTYTASGEVRDYIGPFQYLNNAPFEVAHEEGRVLPGSPNGYEYFLRDHLGNVRAVVASAGGVLVSQMVDYDPWGLELSGLGSGLSSNRAKFNGKETLAELGGGLLDFGARGYDATIGRMHQVDAASELFQAVSGYSYGLNNPIFNIDPTGDTTVPHQEIGPAQWHNFDTKINDIGLSEVSVKTQGSSSGGGGGGSSGGSLVNESGQRINRDGTPYYDPTDMFSTQLMVIPQTEGNEWAERIDNVLAIFSPIKALQGLFVFSKINPTGKVIAAKQLTAKAAKEISNNFSKINDSFLKKSGIDAHQIKKDFLGKKAKIAEYDLYKQTDTGEILILKKGGIGTPIQTGEFLK